MILAMKQGLLEYYVNLVSQWVSTKKDAFLLIVAWWHHMMTKLLVNTASGTVSCNSHLFIAEPSPEPLLTEL